MATSTAWPIIHEERRALLADLRDIKPLDWSTQSLCPDWTVRDVFGHVISTADTTPSKFIAGFAKSGFRFHRLNSARATAYLGASPEDQLAQFESLLDATTHPPGPIDAMVGESIVHGEDIRRPLGVTRDYPTSSLVRAADFYKNSNLLIGSKSRIAGLTLTATDADWSTGAGDQVSGPMLSLVMAMTGRKVAIADMAGPGVVSLRTRH
ncbi:MAG TPA: maleylpyruvate isomerase family mycothiol-dependent enzyme [Actinomycetes bacterium]|nr:maleylpyruvate isomerase family mycothiol-dependent enzyme [Actinomycetes bacterium]